MRVMKMIIFGFMTAIGWHVGKVLIEETLDAFERIYSRLTYKKKHSSW